MTDLAVVTQFLPIRWQPYVPLCALALVVTCKLITVLIPPPAATSRFLPLYTVISKVALNVGWAVNGYQASKKPIMVDKDADRCVIKAKLGIPPEVPTKP